MALKPHLIGGQWVEGTGGQDDLNPSDLRDVVGTYEQAIPATLDGLARMG